MKFSCYSRSTNSRIRQLSNSNNCYFSTSNVPNVNINAVVSSLSSSSLPTFDNNKRAVCMSLNNKNKYTTASKIGGRCDRSIRRFSSQKDTVRTYNNSDDYKKMRMYDDIIHNDNLM